MSRTQVELFEVIVRAGAACASLDGAEMIAGLVGTTGGDLTKVCFAMASAMADEVRGDTAVAMLVGMQAGIMLMNEHGLVDGS